MSAAAAAARCPLSGPGRGPRRRDVRTRGGAARGERRRERGWVGRRKGRPLVRVGAPFREKCKRNERRDNGLASRNPVEGSVVKPCFPRCAASDADHQKADWDSIHEKICPLLTPVRTSVPFFSSEKERKHGAEQLLRRQVRAQANVAWESSVQITRLLPLRFGAWKRSQLINKAFLI